MEDKTIPHPTKLTDPIVMSMLISSMKSALKQQESKKKNYKKLMNLFSVKVQRYEDSSSQAKTDEILKIGKSKVQNKKRRSIAIQPNYAEGSLVPQFKNDVAKVTQTIKYNTDSSIHSEHKYEENKSKFSQRDKGFYERSKFIKYKFNKHNDQTKLKKFSKSKRDAINQEYSNSYKSNNSKSLTPKKRDLNCYLFKTFNDKKDLIFYDEGSCESFEHFKYNDTSYCYSLDQKSKIIYMKPSPQVISSSISSNALSKTETRTNEIGIPLTPVLIQKDNTTHVNHERIIEKLKEIQNRDQN